MLALPRLLRSFLGTWLCAPGCSASARVCLAGSTRVSASAVTEGPCTEEFQKKPQPFIFFSALAFKEQFAKYVFAHARSEACEIVCKERGSSV